MKMPTWTVVVAIGLFLVRFIRLPSVEQWNELNWSAPVNAIGGLLRDVIFPRGAFLIQTAEIQDLFVAIGAAILVCSYIYSVAPRKNGKVVGTPFGLDVLGPLGLLVVVALVAGYYVYDDGHSRGDRSASVTQMGLAIAAFAVITWGYWLALRKRGKEFQLLRDRLLIAIGLSAGLGYANFGHLHFNVFIHTWDTYHYYMGAKYFPEVGYEWLYDCAVVADSEDFPADKLQKMREQRIITNLRTNVMEKVGDNILTHPDDCRSRFSPARWQSFKRDIAFFRGRVNDIRWQEIHHDHGYNASPVWTLLGYVVTNTGPATLDQVTYVNLLDPLYLALMAAMLWWAFGPRVFAVGLIMLGTNWASRFFYWTGGALLRHDWLFYTVAVVCLLKKGRPFLAGMSLAYATLLRLFPGLMLLGPLLAGFEYARRKLNWRAPTDFLPQLVKKGGRTYVVTPWFVMWPLGPPRTDAPKWEPSADPPATEEPVRTGIDAKLPRWLDPGFARFLAGGALATVVLLGASLQFLGGVETWQKFAANTQKHASTPLTNHMGLRTIVSSRPWTNGAHLRDPKLLDNWSKWKSTRVEVFQASRPFFAFACLLLLMLLYAAIRGSGGALWISASLGAGMIAVGAELTNYYYVFFVALAAVHAVKREAGMWLTALVATCIFIMLTPFLGMSGWQDEQSLIMSVASLIAIGGVWWMFTLKGNAASVEQEAPAVLAPSLMVASAPAAELARGKKKKRA
jgi:hypothetical protein